MATMKNSVLVRMLVLFLMCAMVVSSFAGCTTPDRGKAEETPETTLEQNRDDNLTENSETTETSATEPPVNDTERKKVTLRIWTTVEDRGKDGWIRNRLKAFEAAYPEYEFTFKLDICDEGQVDKRIKDTPASAADVYMYTNDLTDDLIEIGALSKLEGTYLRQVQNDNHAVLVDTVTGRDGNVYGFPITSNTWFMYYNKDTYTAEDIKSMDALLEKGTVAMQACTPWYSASFFMANGCTLFGPHGNDPEAGIQFGGLAGYEAAEAMLTVFTHPNFRDDANAMGIQGMVDGTVDAMFSGWWDYEFMYKSMGDKLGCAPLPTITIGGRQAQMKAFAGSRAIGVYSESKHLEEAMMLAAFLTSEESQLKRYELRGLTPAHKNLINNATVAADEKVVAEMAVIESCAVVQPFIPEMDTFWGAMGVFNWEIMNGEVTLDNYELRVNQLNQQLNGDWP